MPTARPDDSGEEALLREPALRVLPTIREILLIALPNITSYTMTLTNDFTNTLMLGQTGDQASLAAVGLGNMVQNCCGLFVGFGIASALDTLVSQAHGAQQHELACHQLQRCRALLTMQLAWMTPVFYYTEDFLLYIGQEPDVARHAGDYTRAAIFGLFAIFQSEATRKFLINRENVAPTTVISVVSSTLHVGWCAYLVLHLKLGNAGAGYAHAITWWTECLLGWLYLACTAKRDGLRIRAVLWVERPGLMEWGSYLRLAVPATVQFCSEWWFWEVTAAVAGYLGKTSLATHVTAMNWVGISFMPATGISASAATLVGNALGANMPRKARCMAWSCALLNFIIWTLGALFMVFGRGPLSAAYSSDPEVRAGMQSLLCIFAVAGYFDSSQNVMGGVLRGMGRQALAAVTYVWAYWAMMLPGGIFVAFQLKLGVNGMWSTFGAGTGLVLLTFAVAVFLTDWRKLAEETAERMAREGQLALTLIDEASGASPARGLQLAKLA